MTDRYGTLVGKAYDPAATTVTATNNAHEKGTDHILIRDRVELSAAPADDRIFLGRFGSRTVLDPDGCIAWFDDLGTGVTIDVGDATNPDGLVDGQDVATAAGSFNLLKTQDVSAYFKPLWEQLGMSEDPDAPIDLYATILGAAATGTFVWQFKGLSR